MGFPTLYSKRLTLRPLKPDDDQAIFELRANASVNKFLDRKPATGIKDAQLFIEKVVENKALYWAICTKNDGALVGTVCLFDFDGEKNSAEIGYELHPDHQGFGFMREAISAVVDHGFINHKLMAITAFPHRENEQSIRLLNKCGFKKNDGFIEDDLLKFALQNLLAQKK